MKKNQYTLNGLTCANCAGKIEKRMAEIEGFEDVSLNFTTQTLSFRARGDDYAWMIQSEIDAIEDGVLVANRLNSQETPRKSLGDQVIWYRLGIGSVLFLLGLIFTFAPPTELVIFLSAYLIVGGDVLYKALKNIRRGQVFDENFLMSVATIGAFAIGEYPEGVTVMLFYQIGELFQGLAVKRSRANITSLMDIRPDLAWVERGQMLESVPAVSLKVGDKIVVKPGERVPLDGIIISGTSMLDTSALTGESLPRTVKVHDEILSGMVNQTGLLSIEVTKNFGESTVTKILDLVENATSKKAETEKFITKFARYYTPVVVYMALALAVIPPLVLEGASFSEWIHRALIFLVVSCPCALVISIPLGFFGGIGGASKHGILIKGSNYLEALNSVETVVFDKTGTLTKGNFTVGKIVSEDLEESQLLALAAKLESQSNHPIAKSIVGAYGREIGLDEVTEFEEVSGKGLKGVVQGQDVLVGNAQLMSANSIDYKEAEGIGTVIHVAVNKTYAGYLLVADEIKEDTLDAIESLRKQGVKHIVMLTGDRQEVADQVGKALGLDQVYAELLPHEKVAELERLMGLNEKGKTIFVGDGINDAPVLARADIGVAMGGVGSDAAIEAADVVLMTDEPSKLSEALKVASRTRAIVWQNIAFAMGVKGLVLILGAGGLATMWEAVFADVGVALIAIVNAMRIIRRPLG